VLGPPSFKGTKMWIFDTNSFVPRQNCGDWPEWLITISIVSNLVIGFAYMAIPALLYYFWRKKQENFPQIRITMWAAAFILFCGLTHIIDTFMFYFPFYRLLILVDVLTACISIKALLEMPKPLQYFLQMKTPGEYKKLVEALQTELKLERQMSDDLDKLIEFIEIRIVRLERELQSKGWVDETNLKLDELKETLDILKRKQQEYDANRTSSSRQ
jgi:hypothetical protein